MTDGIIVEWRDVVKRFGSRVALDGFSMTAGPGVHALLGENGAGKSTALAVLTAARRADSGSVTVGGSRVVRGSRSAELVGFTPQMVAFPANLRVAEILDFVSAHYPRPLAKEEALDRVGLTALARRQCGGLSGGESRRLGVACALIAGSPVVILDEPSAGLDVPGQRMIQELTLELGASGHTVIVASHDLAEIERVADRIWLVSDGRVASHGSPADIVAGLGLSRVEFLAAEGWDWQSDLRSVDPALTPESQVPSGAGSRVRLTTSRPDEVAARVLGASAAPELTVTRPSLGEAIDRMLGTSGAGTTGSAR